ncbi:MAG: hypothetical protein WCG51_07885, partial [Elusimicrobiota bacterium]
VQASTEPSWTAAQNAIAETISSLAGAQTQVATAIQTSSEVDGLVSSIFETATSSLSLIRQLAAQYQQATDPEVISMLHAAMIDERTGLLDVFFDGLSTVSINALSDENLDQIREVRAYLDEVNDIFKQIGISAREVVPGGILTDHGTALFASIQVNRDKIVGELVPNATDATTSEEAYAYAGQADGIYFDLSEQLIGLVDGELAALVEKTLDGELSYKITQALGLLAQAKEGAEAIRVRAEMLEREETLGLNLVSKAQLAFNRLTEYAALAASAISGVAVRHIAVQIQHEAGLIQSALDSMEDLLSRNPGNEDIVARRATAQNLYVQAQAAMANTWNLVSQTEVAEEEASGYYTEMMGRANTIQDLLASVKVASSSAVARHLIQLIDSKLAEVPLLSDLLTSMGALQANHANNASLQGLLQLAQGVLARSQTIAPEANAFASAMKTAEDRAKSLFMKLAIDLDKVLNAEAVTKASGSGATGVAQLAIAQSAEADMLSALNNMKALLDTSRSYPNVVSPNAFDRNALIASF